MSLASSAVELPLILGLVILSTFSLNLISTRARSTRRWPDAATCPRSKPACAPPPGRHLAATWMPAGSFAFSSVMNYVLATWIVTSPAGTAAFNDELGRLTLLSYPMIALPATLMMLAVLYYLAVCVKRLAGLSLSDALHGK